MEGWSVIASIGGDPVNSYREGTERRWRRAVSFEFKFENWGLLNISQRPKTTAFTVELIQFGDQSNMCAAERSTLVLD